MLSSALKAVAALVFVVAFFFFASSYYHYSFLTEPVPLGECGRSQLAWPAGCFQESADSETCLSVRPHRFGCEHLNYSGLASAAAFLVLAFALFCKKYGRN